MFDITDIITALVGLLVAVLTTFAIPAIKARIDATKWERFLSLVNIGVRSVEQIVGAGQGELKLEQALDYIRTEAAKAGLKYDEKTIRAAIETAVLGLKG